MARSFDDASSEYLEIDSSPLSALPITMACWFFLDDLAADHTFMYIGDKDVNDDWFQMRFDQSAAEYRYGIKSGGTESNCVPTAVTASDEWVHIAAYSVATNDHNCLINGGDKKTIVAARDPVGMDRTAIGRMGDSTPGKYMDGRIAEAGVWDVALTDAEIIALASGASPLIIRPQSLVFYLPMVRDNDFDLVGGLSLTAFNTPTIADHPPKMFYPAPVFVVAPAVAAVAVGFPWPSFTRHPKTNVLLRM